jgi:AraC-like DNA-binding protein
MFLASLYPVVTQDTQQEQRWSFFKMTGLVGLAVLLLGLVLYYFFLQRKYKQNFEKLLQEQETTTPIPEKPTLVAENRIQKLGISKEFLKEILKKLTLFEKDLGFLTADCTIDKVAKLLGTNSNYLSAIINATKGKSFVHYINDLRVDYAVKQIKEGKNYNRFTIEGIAKTVGFNTEQAFSHAFHRRHGIYPSYFINGLKGNNKMKLV